MSYYKFILYCSSRNPNISLADDDFAAIYFSSGTTGFPKAILHKHRSLMHAAMVEQAHHGQKRGDCFLCIPPLYHTGAKMHWFGSLVSGTPAVLLRGVKPKWIMGGLKRGVDSSIVWAQDILDAIERGRLRKDYRLDQWRLII